MSSTVTPAPASTSTATKVRDIAPTHGAGGHQTGPWPKIALLVICLLWMIPALGLLITSVRTQEAAETTGWWTGLFRFWQTDQWTLSNYSDVLSGGMATAFVNSIVVSVPATIIPILIAAFAAYAFTFMRFPGRETIFAIVISMLVVPIQVAFVPMLQLFRGFDLVGTFAAVWLLHTGFGMPLAVYIIRNYMGTLPASVIESAKVDGASHFTTFWRLVLPMSVPVLASFAIFQFLWVWNDLLIALIFLGQTNELVTVNLATLLGRLGEGWQLLTAGAFVTMTLPLIVFFSLQRFFVRGLTAGSVKG